DPRVARAPERPGNDADRGDPRPVGGRPGRPGDRADRRPCRPPPGRFGGGQNPQPADGAPGGGLMTARDLLRFSFGALAGHRLRTLLSLLGMAIGVAAVIALTALGEGARLYVVDQFASIGTNLLIVVPGKSETTGIPGVGAAAHDITLQDAQTILRVIPEAEKMSPMVVGTESVAHGARRRQVPIAGTNRDFLEVRKLTLGHGDFLPAEDIQRGRPVVVLGSKLARELFLAEEPVGQVVRIGGWRMRVIGVLAHRGQQLGMDLDDIAIVPVATAMRMFDRRSLFRVMIQVRSTAALEPVKQKVLKLFIQRHREEDVTVLTQDAVVATFSQILGVLTLAVGAIAAISLSVAGIGIMNVMLVSVSERTREVGLLRAVGVGRRQVMTVFLTEAALLSAAGGLLGLGAGWLAVRLMVQLYPALPASPPLWAVFASLGLAMGVGILFGLCRRAGPPGSIRCWRSPPAEGRPGSHARSPPPRPRLRRRPPAALLPLHGGNRHRHRLGDPPHLDRRGDPTLHGGPVHSVRHQPDERPSGQDADQRHPRHLRRHH